MRTVKVMLDLYEYEQSKHIDAQNYQFYALIAAAMRKAGTDNLILLKQAFPGIWESLQRRHHAPLGVVTEWDRCTPEEYATQQQAR